MTIRVKYLPEPAIERHARDLLAAFGHEFGHVRRPPVPVDEILEGHLKLSLDFDDLESRLEIPDVLGALWVDSREVFIDESLDPDEHPEMEGRFRFSVAHEIAHWVVLRQYLKNAGTQEPMLDEQPAQPTVICRTRDRKEPIEWQADYFASCLLMPRDLVVAAWERRCGNLEPIVYEDMTEEQRPRRPIHRGMKPMSVNVSNVIE